MKMDYDVTKLLGDPSPGITLDELAKELNELAKIRENTRLAFCKRLAAAYFIIVGHAPRRGGPYKDKRDTVKFYQWCSDCIRSANGKQYTRSTLDAYLVVGFSATPEEYMQKRELQTRRAEKDRSAIYSAVKRAVTDTPPKVLPITKLKAQGLPTDVAREVNALMTAWEQASSQARSQFIYIVTGKRIAA